MTADDDMLGRDVGEFIHLAADSQDQLWTGWVVGVYGGLFLHQMTAVSAGVDLDADGSLATGGDLPRVGGNRAPSAGFDAFNIQRCAPLVLHDKFVYDFSPIQHR